jgi:hypothetical protein
MDATMAEYKKTNTLSKTDAAYIAGLIDGEGSISLTRRHKNENRQLEVSISNNDLKLLHYVLGVIGAGRITNKKTYSKNHSPCATYLVSNRQALDLLQQIHPYLLTYKAQRTSLVLKDYLRLTPRNGKYNEEIKNERNLFVTQFLATKPESQKQ